MRTPVSGRRPRSGMTLTLRQRPGRPMPMGAVAVRRGRFGEFELRPVRDHATQSGTDTAEGSATPGDEAARD